MNLTKKIYLRIGERGQATIEVILLAFIAVVVILGLIYRFNTAFKKYTTDLYGSYYRCLLETGELPGTGSVCKDRAARFEIANGREKLKWSPTDDASGGGGSSGGNGSGSGGSGGKGSSGSKSGSGNETGGGSNTASSGSSGGDSVSAGGSAGGRGQSVVGRLRQISKRNGSTAVGGAEQLSDDEKNLAGGTGDSLRADYAGARGNGDSLRSARTKMDFAMGGDEVQKEMRVASAPVSGPISKRADRNGDALRPRKAVENTDRKPAQASMKEDSSGMDFGKMFRIFMIVAIIVAIVIFLGGQILQISKSSEG